MQALDGLSLAVPAGSVLGLLGPNGSGKTITVSILATSLRPDAGILVANAGGSFTPPAPLEQIPEDGWRATVDGNLLATFLTLKSFLPGMKERRRGTIITIGSAAGRRADPRSPIPHAAAKAGIATLP